MTQSKNLFYLLLITSFIFLSFSSTSYAQSITSGVDSGTVTKDRLRAQIRTGFTVNEVNNDDESTFIQRYDFDYGVTDNFAVRFFFAGEAPEDENFRIENARLDLRYALLSQSAGDLLDSSFRIGYGLTDNAAGSDEITWRFTAGQRRDGWRWRSNQIFSHEVGQDSDVDIEAETRFRFDKPLDKKGTIGVETFHVWGDLSEQSGYSNQRHAIGPVYFRKFDNNVHLEAAYRHGISHRATDHALRLTIGRNF